MRDWGGEAKLSFYFVKFIIMNMRGMMSLGDRRVMCMDCVPFNYVRSVNYLGVLFVRTLISIVTWRCCVRLRSLNSVNCRVWLNVTESEW